MNRYNEKSVKILTSNVAIKIHSIIDNLIIRHLIKNCDEDNLDKILRELIEKIKILSREYSKSVEYELNGDSLDLKIIYVNGIVYISYDFEPDDVFGFTHKTKLLCITDDNGEIRQDITDYIKGE